MEKVKYQESFVINFKTCPSTSKYISCQNNQGINDKFSISPHDGQTTIDVVEAYLYIIFFTYFCHFQSYLSQKTSTRIVPRCVSESQVIPKLLQINPPSYPQEVQSCLTPCLIVAILVSSLYLCQFNSNFYKL